MSGGRGAEGHDHTLTPSHPLEPAVLPPSNNEQARASFYEPHNDQRRCSVQKQAFHPISSHVFNLHDDDDGASAAVNQMKPAPSLSAGLPPTRDLLAESLHAGTVCCSYDRTADGSWTRFAGRDNRIDHCHVKPFQCYGYVLSTSGRRTSILSIQVMLEHSPTCFHRASEGLEKAARVSEPERRDHPESPGVQARSGPGTQCPYLTSCSSLYRRTPQCYDVLRALSTVRRPPLAIC